MKYFVVNAKYAFRAGVYKTRLEAEDKAEMLAKLQPGYTYYVAVCVSKAFAKTVVLEKLD